MQGSPNSRPRNEKQRLPRTFGARNDKNMKNNEPYIQIKNLSFSYENSDFSLNGLNLNLYRNEITALKGNNGTGKTTLGKLITGILKLKKGNVLINGQDISDMNLGEIGTKTGYLFQNPEKQIFAPTVYEDITFPLQIKGIDNETIEKKATEVMKELEIDHIRESSSFNISQGEKQRTALAGILINDTDFLILDEPTSSLDDHRKDILGKLLTKLKDEGKGVLLISHDDKFIDNVCTKSVILKRLGEISYE